MTTPTGTATTADAQLLVQILAGSAASGADRGHQLLARYASPPSLEELLEEHPQSSEEYRSLTALLHQMEMLGTFVKHGVLNEELVLDLVWVQGVWSGCAGICTDLRARAGEPRLYENFEWLAGRG